MAIKATKQLQGMHQPAQADAIAKACMSIAMLSLDIAQVRLAHAFGTSTKLQCQLVRSCITWMSQIVALFPFFQVDLTSGQQQFLYRLTCIPRVMGVLGGLLGALPIAAQRWLVNWWGGTHPQLLNPL